MEIVLGFLIAVAIGVTGVGAGVITAPVLILFMHVSPAHAVGTALAFSVAVKILVVPMQIYRKQVDYRVLGYLLAGGVPGVLTGSYILAKLNTKGSEGILYAALGSTIVFMAGLNLYRLWFRPARGVVAGLVALASRDCSAHRRRSWIFIGRRGRHRIAGAAVAHSAFGRARSGNGSLLWTLPVAHRQRLPAQRGQLRPGYFDAARDRRSFRCVCRNVSRGHHAAARVPHRAFGVADHAGHPAMLERRPASVGD